jgi:hypothetical protein
MQDDSRQGGCRHLRALTRQVLQQVIQAWIVPHEEHLIGALFSF